MSRDCTRRVLEPTATLLPAVAAGSGYLDAFVEFVLGVGPERPRRTPHWLMKLLLRLLLSAHERHQMLSLLPENLREHQEVARLDSSFENYREIAADVLLMHGGKSQTK